MLSNNDTFWGQVRYVNINAKINQSQIMMMAIWRELNPERVQGVVRGHDRNPPKN